MIWKNKSKKHNKVAHTEVKTAEYMIRLINPIQPDFYFQMTFYNVDVRNKFSKSYIVCKILFSKF